MYCSKCGSEVQENSNFCPICGATLGGEQTNREKSNENCIIRISRPGAVGPARVYKIQFDGFDVGKLGSRSTLDIPSRPGLHTIAFYYLGKVDRVISINVTGKQQVTEIIVKFDLSGKLNLSNPGATATITPIESTQKKSLGCLPRVGIALIAVLAVFIVIVAVVPSGDSNHSDGEASGFGSNRASEAQASSAPEETPDPEFSPVSGVVGNWEITVNDFSYEKSVSIGLLHQYTASENSKYCLVNVTVKNIGAESDTFLPYITYGDAATAKILWNGYEYTRSELLFSNDNLSSENLNPLVTATGDIAFDVPEDLINSGIAPTFVVTAGSGVFSCELVKK